MAKKHKKQGKHSSVTNSPHCGDIKVGNIVGGKGIAIGHEAQAIVTETSHLPTNEIIKIFEVLHMKVNELPDGPDKSVARNALQALEVEAQKGENADETQVQKWMKFLAETAPDAWEVAIDVFTNPVRGIGTVLKKIVQKAKSDKKL